MLKSSARSIGPCLSLPENPARLAGYALFDLTCHVVCGMRPSIHAAYTSSLEEVGVSVTAVYDKLNGIELNTTSALVKESA